MEEQSKMCRVEKDGTRDTIAVTSVREGCS